MLLKIKISRIYLLCTVSITAFCHSANAQHTSSQSLDLKNVKTLQAEIQINAGTLKVTTQSQPKADSRFTYTKDAWKPQIKYNGEPGQGLLSIKQPEEKNTNMKDKDRNDWDIKLPQGVATTLKLRMGAGQGNVDLSRAKINRLVMEAGAGEFNVNLASTSISDLTLNAGVGEVNLDLSGNRTTNLKATINGGIGSLNLVLPRKTGVRVKVNGLGGLDNEGLKKQGNYYVNDAYGKTPHSVDITINGGLGNVELALGD
ncbi:MAG: toast rack family protein [Bacteroidota bacterium]|nr:toast rack family protein [Bacteroidota bacterium]